MSNYLQHWHKPDDETPSALVEPPACCVSDFEARRDLERMRAERLHDDAVLAQRRKLILDGVEAITVYGDSAASVLPDAEAELVRKVTANAVAAFKRVGCICPWLDVSTFSQGSNTELIRGRDGRCGMHDGEVS